jgi:alpha-tubulin suppressor-like RCC1 family protein
MRFTRRVAVAALVASFALAVAACTPPPEGPGGVDTTAPVLTLPDGVTVAATSPAGASVTWSASAVDDVDGSVPVACEPGPGPFPVGQTEVSCSATDSAGNAAEGSFSVIVTPGDFEAPVLSLPADTSAEATGPTGSVVTWTASATDAVDGPVPVTCSTSSGSTFGLGSTGVTCTATDAAGNTATGSFTVTVEDTTAPVLTVPEEVTAQATGPGGASVTWVASATDTVDGTVTVTCTPGPGTFPVGTTAVTCSAADAAGNAASASFGVTVGAAPDEVPPVITLPSAITREATDAAGAAVSYSATALDDVDGSVPVTCAPPSGSTFGIGATTVTCSATDGAGNAASAGFVVTVSDSTPPVLTLPTGISVTAPTSAGATVTWTATAVDAVSGAVTVTCTPPTGTFPVGSTIVQCQAADASRNTSTGTFTVTVAPAATVTQLAAGWNHRCAVMSDRTVRCWGNNEYGQLGRGVTGPAAQPTPAPVIGISSATSVSAGFLHTCAVLLDTSVVCWGDNQWGQLGNGTTTLSNVPVPVTGLTGAVSVDAGLRHTCASLSSGQVRCWGDNDNGQLGDGTTSDSLIPVVVTGITSATRASAGTSFSCAVLSDSTARCWGWDVFQQLGDAPQGTQSSTPVVVAGLSAVSGLQAGHLSSCATRTNGTAWCWGSGPFGGLGNGTTTTSGSPVQVSGLADAAGVGVGTYYACARRTTGAVACWGRNEYGQGGNGSLADSTVPVAVTGVANATQLAVGDYGACVLRSTGVVSCWGHNGYGQLGTSVSAEYSAVPVDVVGF